MRLSVLGIPVPPSTFLEQEGFVLPIPEQDPVTNTSCLFTCCRGSAWAR